MVKKRGWSVIVRSSGGALTSRGNDADDEGQEGTEETTKPKQPTRSDEVSVVPTGTKARAEARSGTTRAASTDAGVTAVSPETHADGQQTRLSSNATVAQLNTLFAPAGQNGELTNQTLVNTFTTRSTTAWTAPEQAAPPLAPSTFISVARNLISAALSPSFAADPTTIPLESPLLWAVLGWVRRQFAQPFADQTPAAALVLTSQTEPLPSIVSPMAGTIDVMADPVMSPNLLVNPGAEVGDPSLSGYSSVTVPGWTVTGTPTVIGYGTLRRIPWPLPNPGPTAPAFLGFPAANEAPPGSGQQYFGGGNVATSTLTQTVDLSAAASDIDAGTVPYALSASLGGFILDPSAASVRVDFLDENNLYLGSAQLPPVTLLDRGLFQTELLQREVSGTIPEGTRSARVVVTFTDRNLAAGNYNNAYADNVSFTVGAALSAPPPPAPPVSTVGSLDHVFIVYMENKGYGDIVGSPNAPYLNSIIDAYGSAANYYALTHPSDPNYYPILGGSDFGTNYNCPANCFDQPNLADSIDAAGLTWAGYAEGGGGYTTPTDRLPFLAFSDIYNDPTRVADHLFDLTQLGPDLEAPSDAPNFVWFAADDATNMEGPTTTITGKIRWAISQLTPMALGGHQYNVAAGDAWLQETLPIILNSPTWQDPTQKSAIFITFDEDYNNLSTGNGNQGNHIVMVVIPSPGAEAAGMRGGVFVADDYYNHYSLQRTIEESLGLDPLTSNDKYAQPMNEFWT
jgi:Phosphoesterase family